MSQEDKFAATDTTPPDNGVSYLTLSDWERSMDVQSASVLSGVVRSFAQVMHKIFQDSKLFNEGTDWCNQHPIAVMYATQIAHLTGVCYLAEGDTYAKAYQAVTQKIEELKLLQTINHEAKRSDNEVTR